MMPLKTGSLIQARDDFKWAAICGGSAVFFAVEANDTVISALAGGMTFVAVKCLTKGVQEVARYIKPEEVVDNKETSPAPQPAQP